MKDLLIKAQGLVDDLNRELSEAKQANAEANQAAASARILKNSLDAQSIELADREISLAQGEKPIKAAVEARRISGENVLLSGKIEESRQDLENKKREFAADIAKQRADLKLEQDEVANTRANFKVQADALKDKEKKLEEKLKALGLKLA